MSSDAPTRQFCEGCNYSFVERDLALNSPMAPRHVVTCGHILCVSCLNKVLTTGLCPVQGDKVHGKKDTQPRTVADHPLAYSLINSTSTDVDASSSTDTAAECCEECQLIPNFTPLAATKGCGLCVEYFCDKHAEYHKSILADHVIVEKEQVQSYAKTITKDEQLMCALHKEPIVRYDKKCDLFICRFCDDEHGLHETTLAFEVRPIIPSRPPHNVRSLFYIHWFSQPMNVCRLVTNNPYSFPPSLLSRRPLRLREK